MSAKKPTALKLVTGNPGKRSIAKHEPRPAAPATLEPPAWLRADAAKEWRRLAAELERVGLLTTADLGTFAAYCGAFGDVVRWERQRAKAGTDLATTPNGHEQQSALVGMIGVARRDMVAFGRLLGLSPVARAGMDIVLTPPPSKRPTPPDGEAPKPRASYFGD